MRAAVFRPSGSGPFPVLVIFHGSGGISERFLNWAAQFAGEGFVVLIGCWLGRSPNFPSPIFSCPGLLVPGNPRLQATATAAAWIDAARRLSGVRSDKIGLVGWSWGATIATLVASSGVDIQATVALAGEFRLSFSRADPSPLDRVTGLRAPILLLHGKRDSIINVEESIDYEKAARAAGKSVEIFLYDEADHPLLFDPLTREDVYRRSVAFLNRYLRP
jgi:carboxymethylenebutenolidase